MRDTTYMSNGKNQGATMNAKAAATLNSLRKMAASASSAKETNAYNRIIDAVLANPSPAGVINAILEEKDAPKMLKLVAATYAVENGL